MTRVSNKHLHLHRDVKVPFLLQKQQILEKLEKWSIFISVSKLTIFNAFEFSRLKKLFKTVIFKVKNQDF